MTRARKYSNHDVHAWLKKLYGSGYRTYYHTDLPRRLQNTGLHMSACKQGLVTKTGRSQANGSSIKHEWEISEHVLNKHTTSFVRLMKGSQGHGTYNRGDWSPVVIPKELRDRIKAHADANDLKIWKVVQNAVNEYIG